MAENKKQAAQPILSKPPGYKDSTNNNPVTKPVPLRPLPGPPRPNGPKPGPPRPKPVSRPPPPTFRAPAIKLRRSRRSCCRICCCFSLIAIVTIAALLLSLGGLFYLWFDPKFPVYHLQSFILPTHNVTERPDGRYLTAKAAAMVGVENPNRKLIFRYGAAKVRLTVVGKEGGEDVSFPAENLNGFTAGAQEKRSLRVVASVRNAQVWPSFKSELMKNASVVRVEVNTRVGSSVWGWNIGMLNINIRCGDTTLKQLDNGHMPKCLINTLKWINIH